VQNLHRLKQKFQWGISNDNNLIWKISTLQLPSFSSCCFRAFRNLNAFFKLNLRKFNLISIHIDKKAPIFKIPRPVTVIPFLRRTLQYETQKHDPSGSKTSILDVCVYVTIPTVNNNISVNFNQECDSFCVCVCFFGLFADRASQYIYLSN